MFLLLEVGEGNPFRGWKPVLQVPPGNIGFYLPSRNPVVQLELLSGCNDRLNRPNKNTGCLCSCLQFGSQHPCQTGRNTSPALGCPGLSSSLPGLPHSCAHTHTDKHLHTNKILQTNCFKKNVHSLRASRPLWSFGSLLSLLVSHNLYKVGEPLVDPRDLYKYVSRVCIVMVIQFRGDERKTREKGVSPGSPRGNL